MKGHGKTQLGDEGYAMVTVIIVIAFVSILATTLLYVSGMNYRMKAVDYHLKENFYESEELLERIDAEFVILVSEAADQAYSEVITEAAGLRDSNTMQAKYNEKIFSYIKSEWSARIVPLLIPDVCDADASLTEDQRWVINADQGYMDVNGFHVKYTDSQGYISLIDTSFRITAPRIEWPVQEAKTAWDAADSLDISNTTNYSECVNYVNWVKR